jgi:peptide-methionine (S)-S-oxide reductase
MENRETATLAGGCFWCTEAIFCRLKGVVSVTPGYAGGKTVNPSYEDVCRGDTGHAESIQILFNPEIIPYKKILEVFFHLHDPTTLNRQGNDIGTQYRSAIFYHTEAQKIQAENIKKEIDDSHLYHQQIVTEISPHTTFYPAEKYHNNYYANNSYAPYCQYVIDPKIQKLQKEFSNDVKSEK